MPQVKFHYIENPLKGAFWWERTGELISNQNKMAYILAGKVYLQGQKK